MFGILFVGFLVLEGITFGVGLLLPFVAKTDLERQAFVQTIVPVWESNQVWVIVAGAILFSGFPEVYATLFSGLYLALFLILATLLLRGMAIVFHDKDDNHLWRSFCCWSIFAGSLIPSFLWGITLACLLQGIPINGDKQYSGNFFDLLTVYTLISGLTFVLLNLLHGTAYLTGKIEPLLARRAQLVGLTLSKYTLLSVVLLATLTFSATNPNNKIIVFFLALTSILSLQLCNKNLVSDNFICSLAASSLSIVALSASIFAGLYPRIIVSSLNYQWSLDIYNAAANPWTLTILTRALLIILPCVMLFEGWKFYIFRHRVKLQDIETRLYRSKLCKLCEKLNRSIIYAKCLTDIVSKVQHALRSEDGTIIKHLQPQNRALLFGKYKLRKISFLYSKYHSRD